MYFERKVWGLPKAEKEAITFFQDKGLLPPTKQCVNGHNMTLSSHEKEHYEKECIVIEDT